MSFLLALAGAPAVAVGPSAGQPVPRTLAATPLLRLVITIPDVGAGSMRTPPTTCAPSSTASTGRRRRCACACGVCGVPFVHFLVAWTRGSGSWCACACSSLLALAPAVVPTPAPRLVPSVVPWTVCLPFALSLVAALLAPALFLGAAVD